MLGSVYIVRVRPGEGLVEVGRQPQLGMTNGLPRVHGAP